MPPRKKSVSGKTAASQKSMRKAPIGRELPPFPPLEQEDLFDNVRERIGPSKYLDFLKSIKEYQIKTQREQETGIQQTGTKSPRASYDKYVSMLSSYYYSKQEAEMRNAGLSLKDVLMGTDLGSEFMLNHVKTYLDDAHTEGAYYNVGAFNNKEPTQTFTGMTEQDRDVLNQDYILPTQMRWPRSTNLNKEAEQNQRNDQNMHIAENVLHNAQVRLNRLIPLLARLQGIVDTSKLRRTQGSKKERMAEFLNVPSTEVAALADYYRTVQGISEKESREEARNTIESLKNQPLETGSSLIEPLTNQIDFLNEEMKKKGAVYKDTMRECYYGSVTRNSEAVKYYQYPSLSYETLLNEFIDAEAKTAPDPSSFLGKEDDVGKNLLFEDTLYMQFESVRWHLDAFKLLVGGKCTAQVRNKLTKFNQVLTTFFDLNITENNCSRAHKGDFAGLFLCGDEHLYTSMRLYHVLITRLNTAYLLSGVAIEEKKAMQRTTRHARARPGPSNLSISLSDAGRDAGDWRPISMPYVGETAEEKMGAFLKAVSKKDGVNKKSSYSVQDFEHDVLAAIGVQGNRLFTVPRILHRIRETVRLVNDAELDLFQKYCEQVKGGDRAATLNYGHEFSQLGNDTWSFQFQCGYEDSYREDDWGSVGKAGEVGRVRIGIRRRGVAPEKKGSKRASSSKVGKSKKKRRKGY